MEHSSDGSLEFRRHCSVSLLFSDSEGRATLFTLSVQLELGVSCKILVVPDTEVVVIVDVLDSALLKYFSKVSVSGFLLLLVILGAKSFGTTRRLWVEVLLSLCLFVDVEGAVVSSVRSVTISDSFRGV